MLILVIKRLIQNGLNKSPKKLRQLQKQYIYHFWALK